MKRLGKTLLMAAGGAIVGYYLGLTVEGKGFVFLSIIMFMGIPFGLRFLSKYTPSIISDNLFFMLSYLAIKLTISAVLGWVVLFVELFRSIYEIVKSRTARA